MKKARNVVLALLCALLLIAGSVAGTLAYLQDSKTVTNTFTAGNVTITMTETKVNEYGVAIADADPVTENEYKLIPGHTYVKDPTIYVGTTSEDCWLFVEIKNGISALQAAGDTTIAKQLEKNGWTPISEGSNVYWHAVASANAQVAVFGSFTIAGDADLSSVSEDTKVVVTAYAVQADGFTGETDAAKAVAAWNATFGAQP